MECYFERSQAIPLGVLSLRAQRSNLTFTKEKEHCPVCWNSRKFLYPATPAFKSVRIYIHQPIPLLSP